MTIDNRPLYEQVADALRTAIERGDIAPGDSLPSEAELQETYNVSRDTVRKALTRLTQEGLITSGQGRTRQVRQYAPLRWALSSFEDRSPRTEPQTGDPWSEEVRRQGRSPSESIELGLAIPPARVAALLHLEANEAAVLRKRIRYVDDRPYQLADSYFPEPIARGTPLMEPRSVHTPGGVLAALGYDQTRYVDEISVRMPSRSEADRLDLPAGTPVAEITRVGYAEDGTPLRVMVSVTPGDRNVLVYEVSVSGARTQ